ncbi:MAG: hypothetical protein K0U98_27275 [Deltaproteobacteria bacterium]|nr:hypothetical protein [Deltaproteobacteria bacterium]
MKQLIVKSLAELLTDSVAPSFVAPPRHGYGHDCVGAPPSIPRTVALNVQETSSTGH